MIEHRAFFGDGEKTFALHLEQIRELERKSGVGFGVIVTRSALFQSPVDEVFDVIRLGLIGGGMSPKEAAALVDTYAKPTPFNERYGLAADIISKRWFGNPEPAPDAHDDLQQDAPA